MAKFTRIVRSLAAAAFLLPLAACAVNPVTGRQELSLFQVSTAEEIALGEKTFPKALQQMGGELPDPVLAAYLSEVGGRLARVSHRPELPYRFKVVNDSSPNAFALPGGFIAVTRGLLVTLENEAQLAAVLGHEVGHVTSRHSVQGMQRGTLLNVALAVVSGATGDSGYGVAAEQAGQLAASLVDRSYSREQERESDRLGIDYMVRAGYDPQGAVQLQEIFYRQVEGGAKPSWLGGLFRSHPFSKERLDANRDYLQQNYAGLPGDPRYRLGAKEFARATSSVLKTRRGYELYDQARAQEASGDLNGAIETFHQALKAAPDEALIYAGLGFAYLRAEDLVPARRHLLQAIQRDGGYYQSHLGLGYVYLQKGETGSAISELERSLELLPTLQGGFLLAEGYEKGGQPARALELYRAVAEADPRGKVGQTAAQRAAALAGR